MAKKSTSENLPAVPPPPAEKTRKRTLIQPEIALEIEQCKKRMSSLKTLNKLTPQINGMDVDALTALEKIIAARKEQLQTESV